MNQLPSNLPRLVLVQRSAKSTIAILNIINQIIINTINQQWKHFWENAAVFQKVSCVLRSRPMRERRSSANEICRARTHTSASSLQFWCQDQPRFLKCIFPEQQACCSHFWCQEYWPTGWQELRKRRLTKSLDSGENFKPYLVN